MQKYEITFITEQEISKSNPVKKEVESLGGKILSESSLGEKQFAYKIKKKSTGYYATLIFELEKEKLVLLNKKLSLDEDILRFLIVKGILQAPTKPDDKTKKTDTGVPEMPRLTAEVEKIEEKKVEKIEEPDKETIKAKITEPEAKKKPVKKSTKKEEVKKETKSQEALDEQERLEALDKKLDELLKE